MAYEENRTPLRNSLSPIGLEWYQLINASMVELVDTRDLKSLVARRPGSTPGTRTRSVLDTQTLKRGGSRWKPYTVRD